MGYSNFIWEQKILKILKSKYKFYVNLNLCTYNMIVCHILNFKKTIVLNNFTENKQRI